MRRAHPAARARAPARHQPPPAASGTARSPTRAARRSAHRSRRDRHIRRAGRARRRAVVTWPGVTRRPATPVGRPEVTRRRTAGRLGTLPGPPARTRPGHAAGRAVTFRRAKVADLAVAVRGVRERPLGTAVLRRDMARLAVRFRHAGLAVGIAVRPHPRLAEVPRPGSADRISHPGLAIGVSDPGLAVRIAVRRHPRLAVVPHPGLAEQIPVRLAERIRSPRAGYTDPGPAARAGQADRAPPAGCKSPALPAG